MLATFVQIVTEILDILVCILYFNTIFSKKRHVPFPLYISGFIIADLITVIPSHYFFAVYTMQKTIILLVTSITLYFLLTFYYETSLRHRIFASTAIYVYGSGAELLSGYFLTTYSNHFLHLSVEQLDIIIQLVSKFVWFLFVIITKILINRKNSIYSLKYNITILITPIFSILILANIHAPLYADVLETISGIIVIAGLIIINVVNYIMLDSLLEINALREKERIMEQQILFQENKYNQISTTYRSTRKILHEVKRHFFYIQECANQKNYDNIKQYLKTAIVDMEHSYSKINTGNLVIDAFVSSHLTLAEHEHISYETDIHVNTELIPIDDYTLCIILGNLLDNSMQECRKIQPPHPRSIKLEIFTSNTEFVIHIINSSDVEKLNDSDMEYKLYHGYGLENVKNLTKQFNGTYMFVQEQNTYDSAIIIPINE